MMLHLKICLIILVIHREFFEKSHDSKNFNMFRGYSRVDFKLSK